MDACCSFGMKLHWAAKSDAAHIPLKRSNHSEPSHPGKQTPSPWHCRANRQHQRYIRIEWKVLQLMNILGMRVNRGAYLTLLHRPWRCKIKSIAQCKNLMSVQSPSPALLQWSNPCFSGTGHCWLDQNLRTNVLLHKCRLILATNQPCHSTTIISNQPHLSAFGLMQLKIPSLSLV
jgi:hypothetical protein